MKTNLMPRPWLDKNGQHKSDDEIRKICKNWTPTLWEEYLKNFEEGQREVLFKRPLDVERFSNEDHEQARRNFHSRSDFPLLKEKIAGVVEELSLKEQEVIRLLYWERLSLRESATILKTSKSSVSRLRNRALCRLEAILIQRIKSN